MKIHCPSCDAKFAVDVTPLDQFDRPMPSDSSITLPVLRAVHAFMVEVGPVKEGTTELYHAYNIRQGDREWPEITKEAFSRCLTRNGATKWRSAAKRGYSIPEMKELVVGDVAPSVQKRLDAEDFQRAVIQSGSPKPDLPFDMG